MGRRHGRLAAVIALVVWGLLATACTSTGSSPKRPSTTAASTPSTTSTTTGPGRLSDKAVLTCGVLWGRRPRPPTVQGVKTVEAAVGR